MEKSFNIKLGKRIREIRLSKGYKQSELADLLNMERSNLTRIESGKQNPKEENLEKLASILDVEIKDFFDFEHQKTRKELTDKIIKLLSELSDNEIKFCYKTLINLKEIK